MSPAWIAMGLAAAVLLLLIYRRFRAKREFLEVVYEVARRQSALAERGREATAEILTAEKTDVSVQGRPQVALRLRIVADGVDPMELELVRIVPPDRVEQLQPGRSVQLRYDPDDPSNLEIDLDSLE